MWNNWMSSNIWMLNNWCWMLNDWCMLINNRCVNNWCVNDRWMINIWWWICMEMNSTFFLHCTLCIDDRFIFWQFISQISIYCHHEQSKQHNSTLYVQGKWKKKIQNNHNKCFSNQMFVTKLSIGWNGTEVESSRHLQKSSWSFELKNTWFYSKLALDISRCVIRKRSVTSNQN